MSDRAKVALVYLLGFSLDLVNRCWSCSASIRQRCWYC